MAELVRRVSTSEEFRHIPMLMQDAQDIHMIGSFEIEDEIWESLDN